ncbi:MAG: protein kinase [Planctomycetes bacterium]|nr:protein kinase [Planctomycetota bacterium]
MDDLLTLFGLDTRLAKVLLAANRVDYPTLHAALTRVRSLRDSSARTLATELLELGLLRSDELEATLAELLGQERGVQPNQRWELGATLAGVELLSVLGRGGMGEVYLARDLATQAQVAIKTVSLGEDEELVQRFQREVEAQARVGTHPHVVGIHRSGVASGRAFLVMDAVGGGDLAERLRAGPLEPSAAAILIRQLCSGLTFAHSQGVLHRDLKPANVLFDEQGVPRLADFGLARLVEAKSLTQTGQILGTPSCMAPEQARGDPADERTDVYGIGAVLFAALTGSVPFSGGGVLAILDQVLNAPPPNPRALNPAVSPALAAICLRALAKSPDDRFSTTQALGEALDSFEHAQSSSPRKALLLAGGALALGVLALAISNARSQPQPGPESTQPNPSKGTQTRSPEAVPLTRDEVKDRVLAAGDGLPGAALAERFLARGEGPPDWLRNRCATPFLSFPNLAEATMLETLGDERFVLSQLSVRRPAGHHDWRTTIHDARSGRVIKTFDLQYRAGSLSGRRIALSNSKELLWFDTESWGELGRLELTVHGVAAFVGEEVLLAQDEEGLLRIELTRPPRVKRLKDLGSDAWNLLPIGGQRVLVGAGRISSRGSLYCLSAKTGAVVWSCTGYFDGKPTNLVLSHDGELVAFGTSTGRIHLFATNSSPGGARRPIRSLGKRGDLGIPKAHRRGLGSLSWLPSGHLISADKQTGGFRIWRPNGELVAAPLSEGPNVTRAISSRDGRRLFLLYETRGRVRLDQALTAGFFPSLASEVPLFPFPSRD